MSTGLWAVCGLKGTCPPPWGVPGVALFQKVSTGLCLCFVRLETSGLERPRGCERR